MVQSLGRWFAEFSTGWSVDRRSSGMGSLETGVGRLGQPSRPVAARLPARCQWRCPWWQTSDDRALNQRKANRLRSISAAQRFKSMAGYKTIHTLGALADLLGDMRMRRVHLGRRFCGMSQ
jgi:hypothetical protein